MTDCIFEPINSSMQAYISALTGKMCPSISHDWLSAVLICWSTTDPSSSFDESHRPSYGPRFDHQHDRDCEHQTQQTE